MDRPATQDDATKRDLSMHRTALCVEYDGTDFSGFQIQNNARTVQQVLEDAVEKVYGAPCRIYGCSRTDAGVHARAHVSHVDLPFYIPSEKIPLALNAHLPDDVVVWRAKEMPLDFHARFSCKGKVYTYRVSDNWRRPCIDRRNVAYMPGQLQVEKMKEAAQFMVGKHDFTAFCASEGLDKNPVRLINRLDVARSSDTGYVEITVDGVSFLYNMVRIIAGTLVYVGQGKINPSEIPIIIRDRQRKKAGKTMPPNGLTLQSTCYSADIFD